MKKILLLLAVTFIIEGVSVEAQTRQKCVQCDGTGKTNYSCGCCSGTGIYLTMYGSSTCTCCRGTGKLMCAACSGTGYIELTSSNSGSNGGYNSSYSSHSNNSS